MAQTWQSQALASQRDWPRRVVLLAVVVVAAVVAALLLCGLVTWMLGQLPLWVWYAVLAVETLPALFLAGALLVGGAEEGSVPQSPPVDTDCPAPRHH